MSDVIKHVLKFQESRRTVFLHAANKDAFGRHRGHVMYGMKLTPNGTKVHIGPGALYTAFGTRLYLDIQSSASVAGLLTLDLNDPTIVNVNNSSIFNSNNYERYPLIVAIIAKFDVYGQNDPADLPQSKQIESQSEVSAEVSFQAKLVTWDRETINPTFDIVAQDPIFMNKGQQSDAFTADYDVRKNYDADSVISSPAGRPAGAIKFDEIVLGYIIIGTPLGSSTPATKLEGAANSGLWADGVSATQSRNSWEALEDFIGADVLFGRNDKLVLTAPVDGVSALSQVPGAWNVGSGFNIYNTSTVTLTPKFGTTGLTAGQFQVEHQNYRLPSFMRDGDSILNVMRRFDYMMRLWMDRTGDQGLIGALQDGTGTGQTLMSPLLNILNYYDGSSSTVTNLNAVQFRDGGLTASQQTPGTDPNNRVLKSGVIPHIDAQASDINTILTNSFGDTHFAAIRALDVCVGNILNNIFGLSVPRSLLRTTADWTLSGVFTDQPINLSTYPTQGSGTLIPNITFPYVGSTINKLIPAVNQLLYRSQRTVGPNLLQNAGFWASHSGTAVGWDASGGVAYGVNENSGFSWLNMSAWPNNGVLQQTVNVDPTAYLHAAGLVSASLLVKNDRQLTMYLIAITGGSAERVLAQIVIPAQVYPNLAPRTVSMTADIGAATISTVGYRFKVVNTSGSDSGGAGAMIVYGAAVNAGMPNPCPPSQMPTDFLSRDGGNAAAMRGDLYLGANDIYFGVNTGDVVWPAFTQNVATNTAVAAAGTAVHQYLTNEPAKAALTVMENRTRLGVGQNWCHNPNGTQGPASLGSQASLPPFWITSASSMSWTCYDVAPSYPAVTSIGSAFKYTNFAGNQSVSNYINLPTSQLLVNDIITAGGLLSGSAFVTNRHGSNSVRLQVSHYNGSTYRFLMSSNTIAPNTSGLMTVSGQINASDLTYGLLMVSIVAIGGVDINVDVHGISCNAGSPNTSPGLNTLNSDYMPRVGGPNHPMQGQLNMGANKIVNLAAGTAGSDAVRIDQLPAGYVPPVRFLSAYKTAQEAQNSGSNPHTIGYATYFLINPALAWTNLVDADLKITAPNFKARWHLKATVRAYCLATGYFKWLWTKQSGPFPNDGLGFDAYEYHLPTVDKRQLIKFVDPFEGFGPYRTLKPNSNLRASSSIQTYWIIETDQIIDVDPNDSVGLLWSSQPVSSTVDNVVMQSGSMTMTWIKDLP